MSCGLSLFMRLPPTTTTTTSSTLQLKVLHIFEMLFANECRQNVGSVIGAGIGRFAVLQQHKTKENLTASLSTHTHTYTCTRTHRKRGTYKARLSSPINNFKCTFAFACCLRTKKLNRRRVKQIR